MSTPTLETRAVELRAADEEGWEVRGIAVPWNELAEVSGVYREQFVRGSLEPHPAGVKLFDQHRNLVGTVQVRDTDKGAEVVGRIARTTGGADFRELVRSGALGHFSVGFKPREHSIEEEPEDGGLPIVTRTGVVLAEVSGVPFPAYAGAAIEQVRADATRTTPHPTKEGTGMTATTTEPGTEQRAEATQTTEAVQELRDLITEQGRRMDALAAEGVTTRGGSAASRFRSAGELLKALAAGDEDARRELRAADAVGPATAAQAGVDTGAASGWINRTLRLVEERRRIVNLFQRAPLPPLGNTVEYPKVASTAGTVGKQAAEGNALNYMEVELDTGTATVGTYGGYSSLSKQAIERGNPAYLDAVFRFQAIQYAKATNADARAALLAMVAGNTIPAPGGVAHGALTAADWIAMVIDAAAAIEDDSLGLLADYMVVGRDVFKSIGTLEDTTGRPIFALPNGGQAVNVAGSASPVTAQFNIVGLPGFVDPGVPANTCKVVSNGAMTTLESPGAPFRMEDENIVNLTKDFSLYGYGAFTEDDANGVVDLDVDGIA